MEHNRLDHNRQAPPLDGAQMPWWMDGQTLTDNLKEPHFLANGVMAFWQKVRSWLLYPLAQLDPEHCNESVLGLLAWDRDITRFKDEPLVLFRKRVKYAFINAQDAGETAGFIRIFQRLGIGSVEIDERMPGRDWDIITIKLTDNQLTDNYALLEQLIRQYGRTCRRYEYQIINPIILAIHASPLDWEHECTVASL